MTSNFDAHNLVDFTSDLFYFHLFTFLHKKRDPRGNVKWNFNIYAFTIQHTDMKMDIINSIYSLNIDNNRRDCREIYLFLISVHHIRNGLLSTLELKRSGCEAQQAYEKSNANTVCLASMTAGLHKLGDVHAER